jgi:hypothetical protein
MSREQNAALEAERVAFEAEVLKHQGAADLSRKPDGSYSNFYLECVWQGFDMRAQLAAPAGVVLDQYDAGLLNDFGGGNVEWWQDYIRAELERAHDFYQSQLAAAPSPAPASDVVQVSRYLAARLADPFTSTSNLIENLRELRDLLNGGRV